MSFQHLHPLLATAALALLPVLATPTARAQVGTAAQQRYEQQIARCNRAGLPAPQRQACVRGAGQQLDRATSGGAPLQAPQRSADGRAEVMAPPRPPSAPMPPSGPQFVPSPDGRAVLGLPPPGDRLERP
ncbi:hypothetical protein PGB34_14295 [Xenophilus arseniciresistens]|uniref:Uncharacterized protein n=1 Tax=Xenophilus arseniciresistens TaxID=1283306 RepID=A0AAE3N8G0_9BURK|nr:hypothetical protein [Xenophilus arseniciresistens]MDA7417535.1 hypothetical protein [Xenophilus arseniciresistens]